MISGAQSTETAKFVARCSRFSNPRKDSPAILEDRFREGGALCDQLQSGLLPRRFAAETWGNQTGNDFAVPLDFDFFTLLDKIDES